MDMDCTLRVLCMFRSLYQRGLQLLTTWIMGRTPSYMIIRDIIGLGHGPGRSTTTFREDVSSYSYDAEWLSTTSD
jgi:hypothetical protein